MAFREVRDEFGESWAFCCLGPMELGARCRNLGLDAIEAARSFLARLSSADLRTICHELCWAGPQLDRCSDSQVLGEVACRMASGELVVCEAEHARRIFEEERQRLATALQPYVDGGPSRASAPMPGPPRPTQTWFKVKVVDEMSEPLQGVELFFSFDRKARATDGAGTIEVSSVASEHHHTAVRTPPSTSAPTDGLDARAALDSLRAAVKPSWNAVRPGPWYEPGPGDIVVQLHGQAPIDTSLLSERLRTIVVQPWVVRLRLLGAYFDTNKCFLLPSAVTTASGGTSDVQAVRQHILENPRSTPLIVGHTDASGEPACNDPLSLERADAVAAYLRNDADAWLSWYEATRPPEKRWGANEDQSMLSALPDYGMRSSGEAPVWWFQRTRGLGLDGIAGPETRGALIQEYMALGGGALPADVAVTTHGCGETFPREDLPSEGAADEAQAKQQRRVEIYLFDGPLGVQPQPPGEISKPGTIEYPEWVRRARETHDYSPGVEQRSELWVRFELTPESAASRTDELRLKVQGGGVLASKRLGVDHVPNESSVDVRFLDLSAACPLSLEIVPASGAGYLLFEGRTLAELATFCPAGDDAPGDAALTGSSSPLEDDVGHDAGATTGGGTTSTGGEFEQGSGLGGPVRAGATVHAVLPTLLLRRLSFANPPALQLYLDSDAHDVVKDAVAGFARGEHMSLPDWEGRSQRSQSIMLLPQKIPSSFATFFWSPKTAIRGTVRVTARLTGNDQPYGQALGRKDLPLDAPAGKDLILLLLEFGGAMPSAVGQFGLELDWEVDPAPGFAFKFAVEGQAGKTTHHPIYVGHDRPLDPTKDEPVRDDQDTRTATPKRLDKLMSLLGPKRWRRCATGPDLEELIWSLHTELHRVANPPYFVGGEDIHLWYGDTKLPLDDQWLMWIANARHWNGASCIGHVQLLKTMLAPLGIHIRRRLVLPVTTERPPESPGGPTRPVSASEIAGCIEGRVLEGQFQRTDIRNQMTARLRVPGREDPQTAFVALMSAGGRGDFYEGCALTPAGRYLPAAIPSGLVLAQAPESYRGHRGFASALEVLRFWASMKTASGYQRFMCWVTLHADGPKKNELEHSWDRDGRYYPPSQCDRILQAGRQLPIP